MLASILLAISVATIAVLADPVPLEPAPGNIYNEGGLCHVVWTADPTGLWKQMAIQFMTGSNDDMIPLSTIAILDGTDTTNTTLDYPCLSVTLNSAVYFYQFTAAGQPNTTWTGRFAIADANGNTVPPPNALQPDGEAKPWGAGNLTDPSQAVPPPNFDSQDSGSTTVSATGGAPSAPAPSAPAPSGAAPASSAPSKIVTTTQPSQTSNSNSPANAPSGSSNSNANTTTTGDEANTNSAVVALEIHGLQMVPALLLPALLFVTMF